MKHISISLILLLSLQQAGCGEHIKSQALSIAGQIPRPVMALDGINAMNNDVIVQLFNWTFSSIASEIPTLAMEGYGQIHVSPPNLTIAGDAWWARYQPVDYRLIAGPLGSESQFKEMIAKAHEYGIRIIVDIVFNHTANPSSPMPAEAKKLIASQGRLFSSVDYHPEACIVNYDDIQEVRNNRICGGSGDEGLPDLDQNSARVLSEQHAFLLRLSSLGVDGYRFDAIKHMDPSYFPKLLTADVAKGKFMFGEVIADASTYDRDLAPYLATQTMGFYDFPLRATIQEAFTESGSLSTLVDSDLIKVKKTLPNGKGIGFVMNHDIPNNDGFRGMILEPEDEMLAYAYLMGRDGMTPYVYSDLGTRGGGGLRDDRWDHAHRDPKLVSLVKFHNATRGQPMKTLVATRCFIVIQRGSRGIILINKCDETLTFSTNESFAGPLIDVETGLPNSSDSLLNVPGRSSLALIAQ